jgi:hypothetical protein
MPILKNWYIGGSSDPDRPPELSEVYLFGEVSDHPKHEDGTPVRSTPIVGKDYFDRVVTRSGSKYSLLDPKPEYEAKFPDCLQRLINSLQLVD